MNLIEVTQVLLVATGAVLLGRVGLALTRWLERRLNATRLTSDAADRLQNLEDECARLRREVSELQERQDFTERALLKG
jgi:HAMP domain-containing protein